MGTGHVMRCLALAQAWQDAGGRAVFAVVDATPAIKQRLQDERLGLKQVAAVAGTLQDAKQTAGIARDEDAGWIIADGYQFGAEYQSIVKAAGLRLLFVDDDGRAASYAADLVLNQNAYADESLYPNREPYTRLLLGSRYVLLRREFEAWCQWKREIPDLARKILVTMGGSDPDNFTERAIEALTSIEEDGLQAAVVVGGSNARSDLLEGIAARSGQQISLRRDISNMAELMAWADLAVSAAGTTSWEMCRMGLPALLIDLAENQTPVARELDRRRCAIHLGSPRDVSSEKLAQQVKRLLHSREDREAMSLRGRELVDGKGTRRVVSALRRVRLCLRSARENDSRLLWEWANDGQVRAAAFSSSPIPWEQHEAWFAEKLRHDQCHILIAEDEEGTPVGQIRFDTRADGVSEIDVSIARAWRGQGLAVTLIQQGAQSVLSAGHCTRLRAFVKPENVASVKAFEKAGFKRIGIEQVRGNAAVHLIYEAK